MSAAAKSARTSYTEYKYGAPSSKRRLRKSALKLLGEHVDSLRAANLVFDETFTELKFSIGISTYEHGGASRKLVVVTKPCGTLRPGDELVAVNDALILFPEDAQLLRQSIVPPVKLTFVKGLRETYDVVVSQPQFVLDGLVVATSTDSDIDVGDVLVAVNDAPPGDFRLDTATLPLKLTFTHYDLDDVPDTLVLTHKPGHCNCVCWS